MSRESIRQRVEAATPGPWRQGHWSGRCHLQHEGTRFHPGGKGCVYDPEFYPDTVTISTAEPGSLVAGQWDYEYGGIREPDDAAFVAHARQDIPALLAAMDGLVLALEQMEREHGHHNIPGSVTCYGCGSVAKARAALRDLEAQP
jgi:hypothetical protein